MKNTLVAGTVWLIASLIITYAVFMIFEITVVVDKILILMIVMVAVSYLLRIDISPKAKNRDVTFTTQFTNLPLSSEVVGPAFGVVPSGITITYRNAIQTPILITYFRESKIIGFEFDFCNGQIGVIDGSISIKNTRGSLKFRIDTPDGYSSN